MAARFCSSFCNVTASLLGWGSLAVSIASVTVIDWVDNGDRRFGLFYYCDKTENEFCYRLDSLDYIDHWMHAVRAFVIQMIVYGGFACLVSLSSQLNKSVKNLRIASSLFFFLAGIAGAVGCAVFTGKKELKWPDIEYGSAYIMGWVSTGSFLIAGIFQTVSGCLTPKYEVYS